METGKKAMLVFAGLVLAGALVGIFFPKEQPRNNTAAIRVGAGDDISGILMEEIAADLGIDADIQDEFVNNCFQDCCSNTAQWAMTSGEINAGFFCSHMAKHLIDANEQVFIYGPVIMNAEIVCYRGNWEDVRVVGMNQGRVNEKVWVEKSYPQIEHFEEITQKGILYSLERGQVDAVIQDLTKASRITQYPSMPVSASDYISYVLVVEKEFARTPEFAQLVRSYNKAAEKLNDRAYLAEKLGVPPEWLADKKVQFLQLDEVENEYVDRS